MWEETSVGSKQLKSADLSVFLFSILLWTAGLVNSPRVEACARTSSIHQISPPTRQPHEPFINGELVAFKDLKNQFQAGIYRKSAAENEHSLDKLNKDVQME